MLKFDAGGLWATGQGLGRTNRAERGCHGASSLKGALTLGHKGERQTETERACQQPDHGSEPWGSDSSWPYHTVNFLLTPVTILASCLSSPLRNSSSCSCPGKGSRRTFKMRPAIHRHLKRLSLVLRMPSQTPLSGRRSSHCVPPRGSQCRAGLGHQPSA